MLAKLRNKRKEKKGFTLLELIIVIAIIAILLALLVPNLTKFLGNAKTTSKDANAKTVYTSASTWAADLATDNIAIKKTGTITIDKKIVADGGVVETADATKLLTYLNGDNIKNAKVEIVVDTDYSITSVKYYDTSGDTKPSQYPK